MEPYDRDAMIAALHEYHTPYGFLGSCTAIDHWTIPGYVVVSSLTHVDKPALDIYTEADLERWWDAAQELMAEDPDEWDLAAALPEVESDVFTRQEV